MKMAKQSEWKGGRIEKKEEWHNRYGIGPILLYVLQELNHQVSIVWHWTWSVWFVILNCLVSHRMHVGDLVTIKLCGGEEKGKCMETKRQSGGMREGNTGRKQSIGYIILDELL